MLLAELEVWHTRAAQPTRRVALGNIVLPTEPPPGFGGVLLAAVVAGHLRLAGDEVDDRNGVRRLLDQIVAGERVVQPRLAHRYQVDRHGLACTTHRLVGEHETLSFQFGHGGRPMAHVLGALYAVERFEPDLRAALHEPLLRALRWHGPIGPSFVAEIVGGRAPLITRANPRAWALDILGFEIGGDPDRKAVLRHYRQRLRAVHPDLGGSHADAVDGIEELNEARSILLA